MCGGVFLEGWLKSAAQMGGDSWWARQIRDKLKLSAFCLVHAPLQHKRASNTGPYQTITLAGILHHKIT